MPSLYVIVSELNFQNRMKSFNSEFLEKYFPETGEKFRWYTALRFEKQLFTENETFQTISNETSEKFNSIEAQIDQLYKEKDGQIGADLEAMLKDGE